MQLASLDESAGHGGSDAIYTPTTRCGVHGNGGLAESAQYGNRYFSDPKKGSVYGTPYSVQSRASRIKEESVLSTIAMNSEDSKIQF